jgi:putative methyltransferase (TIGR04325 family)
MTWGCALMCIFAWPADPTMSPIRLCAIMKRTLSNIVTRGLSLVKPVPSADRHDAEVDSRFESNTEANMFRGVFDTWEATVASAPCSKPLGYDNPECAELYLRHLSVEDWDYPALFWIAESVEKGLRQFADIGGSVGIKYYAFGKFVKFPPDLRWRVIDVPAVVARGREFALQRGAGAALEFSTSIEDIDGVDVVFASGSLQYLPRTLPDLLRSSHRRPRRIVINTTPFHDDAEFFTLNSVGAAFCPYRVQRTESFVSELSRLGYRLRDQWRNIGKPMHIPFHPDESLRSYTGFCFDAVEN